MKKIMISAGEASGDLNGAELALRLKELCPSAELKGMGGEKMKAAGVEVFLDISRLAAVGFSEAAKNFGRIRKVFYGFCAKLDEENPHTLVLIDYPVFNLRLAAHAKKRNIRVVYYISPQVWAWWRDRVYRIARTVDRMIVIFPFEKSFYEKFGVKADYVGHPAVDRLGQCGRPGWAGFPGETPLVCLLPGSRSQEVARHLPVMLEAASLIKKSIPGADFVVGRAGTITRAALRGMTEGGALSVRVAENEDCAAVRMSDFVIASSGTATAEAAYLGKPMVVMYSVSALTWLFARLLVRVPHIAMVNVLAGRRIVPEFVQYSANPYAVSRAAVSILESREKYDRMKADLQKVRSLLGPPGAARRAAALVLDTAGKGC